MPRRRKTAALGMMICLIFTSIGLIATAGADGPLTFIAMGSGMEAGEEFGHFVEHIPDMTGDGLSELMVGAPYNSSMGGNAGAVFIFFSPLSGKNIDAGNADIEIMGTALGQNFGFSGAVLPNTFTDQVGGEIAIGCPDNDSGKGIIYIFELNTIGGGGSFSTDDADYRIHGQGDENFGHSVARAGDVNDDAVIDLVVGAPNGKATNFGATGAKSGRAYVFHGGAGAPGADSSFADVTITGYQDQEKLGFAVSCAGDVNSDTNDDLMVGAPENMSSGKVSIFFGGALAGFIDAGNADVTLTQGTPNAELGYSVNSTGDFNGDGLGDVIAGAPGLTAGRGAAFVVFGNATLANINFSEVQSGYVGFNGIEVGRLGHSVSGSRDMDGDGFDDCIVGAPLVNESRGFSFTFFGNASFPTPPYIPSNEANATNNGTTPAEKFGFWVSEGGNVNGDVYMDAFAGAPNATGGKGKVYIMKVDHLPTLLVPEPVSPSRGNATTEFTYWVVYTDIENDPPASGFPRVFIYKDFEGVSENASTPNAMLLDTDADAALHDGDYTNGERYYFNTVLGVEHDFNYLFEAEAESGLTDKVRTALQTNETLGAAPEVDTTPPPTISNVTVTDTPDDHGGSIDVNWKSLSTTDFDSYEIFLENYSFTDVGLKQPTERINNNLTTTHTFTTFEGAPLEDYTDYWVAVGARDDMGNRIMTVTSQKVIPKDNFNLPPGTVTDLHARGGDNEGEVILNWTAIGEDNLTNGPVSEYMVKYSTIREFITTNDWTAGTTLDLDITPLAPGQMMEVTASELAVGVRHYFAVKSIDGVGQMSGLSNSAEAAPSEMPDTEAPEQVLGVQVYDVINDNVAIGVSWWMDSSIDFHHYNIYVSEHEFLSVTEEGVYLENSSITDKMTTQATISSMNDQPFEFGKTYYAAVTAVDKKGNENTSVICSSGILFKNDFDAIPPMPVEDVLAVDTDDDNGGSITVTWSKCEAADFLFYRVLVSREAIAVSSGPGIHVEKEERGRNNLSFEVTKIDSKALVNGDKYYFAVVVVDYNEQVSLVENSSRYGPVEPVNDSDTDEPPAVSDFKIKADGTGTNYTTLSWKAFTNSEISDFHQYVIFYSTGSPVNTASAVKITGTEMPGLLSMGTATVVIEGLEKETTHYFVIMCQDDRMAKDGDLDGTLSEEISVTTGSDNFIPVLSEGKVIPDEGRDGDTFTFQVKFKDTDSSPDYIKVVIDNETYEMELSEGNKSTGAIYVHSMKLKTGTHTYYFIALDSYFSGDDSKEVRYPGKNDLTITVEKEKSGGGGSGSSSGPIVVIVIVIVVLAAAAVVLLLIAKKKKGGGGAEKTEPEEEKEVKMWTCSCGDISVPETEAAHCGFCGEYHEPFDSTTEGAAVSSSSQYPDYSKSLYGDAPAATDHEEVAEGQDAYPSQEEYPTEGEEDIQAEPVEQEEGQSAVAETPVAQAPVSEQVVQQEAVQPAEVRTQVAQASVQEQGVQQEAVQPAEAQTQVAQAPVSEQVVQQEAVQPAEAQTQVAQAQVQEQVVQQVAIEPAVAQEQAVQEQAAQ